MKLGDLYLSIKNYEKAIESYRQAADKGNIPAMLKLGDIYGGIEKLKNVEAAIEWYEKAANTGNSEGMFNLAWIYQYETTVKNVDKAIFWCQKAANLDNPDAMALLGDIYLSIRDLEHGNEWYQKAATAGDERSINYLIIFEKFNNLDDNVKFQISASLSILKQIDPDGDKLLNSKFCTGVHNRRL
ncbi:MAG: tetratricopeptide repeat protein [Neisseriaceae bacterium]